MFREPRAGECRMGDSNSVSMGDQPDFPSAKRIDKLKRQ